MRSSSDDFDFPAFNCLNDFDGLDSFDRSVRSDVSNSFDFAGFDGLDDLDAFENFVDSPDNLILSFLFLFPFIRFFTIFFYYIGRTFLSYKNSTPDTRSAVFAPAQSYQKYFLLPQRLAFFRSRYSL